MAQREAEYLMEVFYLTRYANELVPDLSLAGKANVLCATAFLSPNQIVLLDEPTEGMDVINRNKLWKSILKMKKNRTIIFMTNNVEEAEIVGDRIVILSQAEVQIKGTLKRIRRSFRKAPTIVS